MNKNIFILILSLVSFQSMAQKKNWVQGIIFSKSSDKGLVGASIKNHTLNNYAVSTLEGKFSTEISSWNDSLTISCIGYLDRTITAFYFQNESILEMEPKINYLDEAVVNTGYQTLKSNEVTGAVDVLDEKMLNQQVGTSILQRLNNITTAIRFDNQAIQNTDLQKLNISVRGLSTINGNLDPLIVLDGFIYEGNMDNIDPNGIASVSILKDAAASAIWGARAGNGVIVITSKKGVYNTESKTDISVSSNLIWKQKPNLHELYQLDNRNFMEVENFLFDKGYYTSNLQYMPHLAVTPVIDILDRRKRNLITPIDSTQVMDLLLMQDGRGNFMDAFYQVPFVNQHSLNIRGGSNRYTYSFGAGYTGNKSELDDFNRKLNIQLSNSFRPTDKIQIDLNVLYTNQHSNIGRPDYGALTYNGKKVPYDLFFDEIGNEIPFEKDYRKIYLADKFSRGYLDWNYYPLSENKYAQKNSLANDWFSSLNLKYKLFTFLNLNVGGQFQNQQILTDDLSTVQSYDARRLINQYTTIGTENMASVYNIPVGGIKRNNLGDTKSYTLRAQADLNKKIGSHHLIGILGAEIREHKATGSSYTAYGYHDLPLSSSPVDFTRRFTLVPDLSSRSIPGAPQFYKNLNRFVSMYSNLTDKFLDKYALSLSIRRDGANIFGANANDKWSPLWSVGTSWDVSKESFFKIKVIDFMKMRATYGLSGNVDLRRSPDPIAYVGVANYSNYPMLQISNLNDPSLRWEKVGTTNIGVDLGVLKSRISARIDYYIKNGKDLYGQTEYDYTTWGKQGTIVKNVASMVGKGMDIEINSKNLTGKFSWDSRLLVSINRNKTTSYFDKNKGSISSFLSAGNTITPIVGKPLNALAAYKWMGLNNQGEGQGVLNGELSTDYNAIRNAANTGNADSESVLYIGSSKPQVFGNIINTFGWKSLSLSLNMSYKADYYIRKPVTSYYSLFAQGTAYPDFEDRWQQAGDESSTHVPGMRYPLVSGSDEFYQNSDINVYKGDHLRLEYINASWRKSCIIGGRKVDIGLSFNASNLGVIWKSNKIGFDPEFPYRLSQPKTYSLGLNISY